MSISRILTVVERRYRAEAFAKALGEWSVQTNSKSRSWEDGSPGQARAGRGEAESGGPGECVDVWGGRRLGTNMMSKSAEQPAVSGLGCSPTLGGLSLESPAGRTGAETSYTGHASDYDPCRKVTEITL